MNTDQTKKPSHWHKEVRAPFWRVMAWDTLFFVPGIGVGAGVGAFLAVS
ncbi:MAG: hypothetical protein LV468_01850 [Candidatus Nitrosotenuis sp.]|nr:hypothetical protein [Candidatus Nitrosotenuis sp.]